MVSKLKIKIKRGRVADEIMAGMREIERMLDSGKKPEEMFTVRTVEIPDPQIYTVAQIRALRDELNVSQTVFAHLLGISVVLVKSWEQGSREPGMMARRLLDTIKSDPSRWLASVREMAVN